MKQILSKLLILMALVSTVNFAFGQDSGSYKNQVKINVAALALKNFSFQYQRAVTGKIAVGLSLRTAPKSTLPFQGSIESLIDDADAYNSIKNFKTGNFSITPEVRFYFGESVFKGFYVAPFASYSTYNASGPFTFSSSAGKLDMPLSGDIKTVTGGIFIGSQFNLTSRIGLDIYIGPNYGSLDGTVSGNRTLNADEQNGLRDGLSDLDDIPMIKSTYTVNGNGATLDLKGNWPGLRGGIAVAFKF
ncbi:MAG: DUF3575 domain-containing protein [Bacteroidota bacterium]